MLHGLGLNDEALVEYERAWQRIGEREAEMPRATRIVRGGHGRVLNGIGKAAEAMMDGACDVLGARLRRALVVRKAGLACGLTVPGARIEVIDAAHPVPDASSLEAGRRVCEFVDKTAVDDNVLILISGGASSLIERLRRG